MAHVTKTRPVGVLHAPSIEARLNWTVLACDLIWKTWRGYKHCTCLSHQQISLCLESKSGTSTRLGLFSDSISLLDARSRKRQEKENTVDTESHSVCSVYVSKLDRHLLSMWHQQEATVYPNGPWDPCRVSWRPSLRYQWLTSARPTMALLSRGWSCYKWESYTITSDVQTTNKSERASLTAYRIWSTKEVRLYSTQRRAA